MSNSSCSADLFKELDAYIDSLNLDKKDFHKNKGHLIQILHKAQELFGYLPESVQIHIGKRLDISPAKVFGVVSFYSFFTMEPRGEHVINVCMGTACYVRGADKILEEFEKRLGIKSGKTTEDGLFTLTSLRCVGACGLAPVVIIDDEVYGKVKKEDVEELINKAKNSKKENTNA
ncbi:MAG TPA: NAD(P)H-dependent oxidoreductase subunit E [Spirochaetota bacterium]|nr:NAD(P)H-dependent oxidoreductase subunit E [Spirochaetota bacterium]HOL57160.1 NAD(P)H-dependent oxidoreductase subunit E [Spirochaetota bacterium]HPP04782.1 NAD(P)H-dependent oxidoreductase subunit E [Spirochaetota bacterium]